MSNVAGEVIESEEPITDLNHVTSEEGKPEQSKGYFYFLREREFVLRNEDVYKIGITVQENPWNRLNQYKKGSEIILLWHLQNPKKLEDDVKKVFRYKFTQHMDGIEYFEGDKDEMFQCIHSLMSEHRSR